MAKLLDPLRFLVICLAGRLSQRHLQAIDYLCEENRIISPNSEHLAASGPIRRRRLVGAAGNILIAQTAVEVAGAGTRSNTRAIRGPGSVNRLRTNIGPGTEK